MSDYFLIENFNQGLDTRRMSITTKAGALLVCKNAHLTRGGEIEKAKAFVDFADLPAGQTFGLHAAANELFVFGSLSSVSVPTGINYQILQHPAGVAMIGIIYAENFSGKIYAIARFADGAVYHFYDGARVITWDTIFTPVSGLSSVATAMAGVIDEEANFAASAVGAVVTITAANPGVPFGITKSTTNGGAVGDQDIVLLQTVANGSGVAEVLATGSFFITGGTFGAGNQLTSLKVNAVDILTGPIPWNTTNENTAQQIVTAINALASVPNYTAIASGNKVIISAVAGSGATPNGFVVAAVAAGTLTVGTVSNMSGGVTQTATAQVYTATITGTFEIADTYTINLSIPSLSYVRSFTVSGSATGMGVTAKTFSSKVYSTTDSLIYFCEINDPTKWNTNTNGSGFINIANADSGSDTLTALASYQGKLAIFSKRSVQIWNMDPDPTQNVRTQILDNIGTYAPRSVVNFGDLDTFFLSYSGIRSLRARDASNAATVSDIGTNIDTLIANDLLALTDDQKAAAVGIIEPSDGRYMLAIGDIIYVYSYFPTPGISAWSTYEPGFTVSDFAYANNILYARSNDAVYAYGGTTGDQYDNSTVQIDFPYLDGSKPATQKTLVGFDASIEGTWDVRIGMDLNNPIAKDLIGTFTRSTWMDMRMSGVGIGTHFGVSMTSTFDGYCRIGNFALHFDVNEAD